MSHDKLLTPGWKKLLHNRLWGWQVLPRPCAPHLKQEEREVTNPVLAQHFSGHRQLQGLAPGPLVVAALWADKCGEPSFLPVRGAFPALGLQLGAGLLLSRYGLVLILF